MSNNTPLEAKEFQIVPVHCDSLGQKVYASNAIAHGSLTAIAENIRDSRARNDSIRRDAAKDREIASLRKQLAEARAEVSEARADAAQARTDAAQARAELGEFASAELQKATDKLGTLAQRMDELEQPEEEPIVYPPGTEPELEPSADADPDPPADLPPEASPGGDLHTIEAKRDGDSDDQEPLPRFPLPLSNPEMGSEPELTLPPDPPKEDD
jgi:hypothetical protein